MSPSNFPNNSVSSTPKIQPLGWTSLPVSCPVAVAAEVAKKCRRIVHKSPRCTHERAQNGEPTRLSSGLSGWPAAEYGTRVAAGGPSYLELRHLATFLAESSGAMASELPEMHLWGCFQPASQTAPLFPVPSKVQTVRSGPLKIHNILGLFGVGHCRFRPFVPG